MNTNFAKEFKLYETLNTKNTPRKTKLVEARSVADIEAEIEKLKQELAQAKVAEKKASYGSKVPRTVWVWSMWADPSDKGGWTSYANDIVFETERKALDAAYLQLSELDDEGELGDGDGGGYTDPDDYTVEAYEIPIWRVDDDILTENGLEHLVDRSIVKHMVKCPGCWNIFLVSDTEKTDHTLVECPCCKARLRCK